MVDLFYAWSILQQTKKGVEIQGYPFPLNSKFYFLVGAGVSVDAYLNPFRGPLASASLKPLLQSNSALEISRNGGGPEEVKAWKTVLDKVRGAKPTMFHECLGLLEEKNSLGHVWTQNFDGLELKAGVPFDKVTMLHGDVMKSRCMICGFLDSDICIEDSLFRLCNSCASTSVQRNPDLARTSHRKTSYLVPCIDYYEPVSPFLDQEEYSKNIQNFLNDPLAVMIVAGTSLSNDVKGALHLVRQAMKSGVQIFWWNLNESNRTDIQFTGLYLGDIQRISLDFITQFNSK
jgi:NAD-dependent SIR2 family protein deacetylase